MAFAYIAEYSKLAAANGLVQAGHEPSLVEHKPVVDGTSRATSPFLDETKFVRIEVDVVTHLKFGPVGQTALITHKRMAANTTEFFGVNPGDVVAVLLGA